MQNINSVSTELCVRRFSEGIKLIKPGHTAYREDHSLYNIIQVSFPVYLEDAAHHAVISNEQTAMACGFTTLKDYIGKSPFKHFKTESIIDKIANHQKVLQNNTFMIAEETAILNNGNILNTLSLRMPWYNDENRIMGLFGCSIVLGQNSLAESLNKIAQLGIFNLNTSSSAIDEVVGTEIDSNYFSRRELDCLRLTVKGKPAKQVAYELNLSQRTVEEYLDNIKRKFQVSSKAALIEKGLDFFLKKINVDINRE